MRTGYEFASSRIRHARSDSQRQHHAAQSVKRGVERQDRKRRLTFTMTERQFCLIAYTKWSW